MKHLVSKFTNVSDLLDQLKSAEREHLVRVQTHPEWDCLKLFTYTEETQYSRNWTPASIVARGLIIDTERNIIVGLPFSKFFNLGELDINVTPEEFKKSTIYTKYDGSLIIMYYYRGRWNFATKGSFISDQAKAAENYFYSNILQNYDQEQFVKWYTYLFEWTSPNNRIVLEYTEDKPVVLGCYDVENYKEMSFEHLNTIKEIEQPEIWQAVDLQELLTKDIKMEGWVIKTPTKRVKLKTDWYVQLHKIVSDFSRRRVFEYWKDNKTEEYKKELPEEFWPEFDRYSREFSVALSEKVYYIDFIMNQTKNMSDKEIGLSAELKPTDKTLIFAKRKTPNKLDTIVNKILAAELVI